ncbi:MAG: hypothetical protein PHI97_14490 [Desulfobulbus sp.]|nr:hypothetical protein [Desulfobulbus sp.]
MVKYKPFRFIGVLCIGILISLSLPNPAPCKQDKSIVLTLPAETVLSSVQKMLPLEIPSQSRRLQGDIIFESLNALTISNNSITIRGVIAGHNLVVTTQLAGQDIQLQVGEVRFPVTCNLKTRFDPARRKLYVTPSFPDAANGGDDLAPMLGALTGREYQVDLDALESLNIRVGSKSIPITMEPIKIIGTNNTLVFYMLPRVGTPR